MHIIFSDDSTKFGFEKRVRDGREHWHIILFHRNICLSLRWWSRDNSGIKTPGFSFEVMFDNLDKKVKFKRLK